MFQNFLTIVDGQFAVIVASDKFAAFESLQNLQNQGHDVHTMEVAYIGESTSTFGPAMITAESSGNVSAFAKAEKCAMPSNEDVMNTAVTIATVNPNVTTLEVKESLRKRGFYATQKMISTVMDREYEKYDLDRENNGQYFEYFMPQVTATSYKWFDPETNDSNEDDGEVTHQASTPSAAATTKSNGKPLLSTVDPLSAGENDWEVNQKDSDSYVYYTGNHTSDEVRNSFAKEHGFKMQDIRARRVRNSKVISF